MNRSHAGFRTRNGRRLNRGLRLDALEDRSLPSFVTAASFVVGQNDGLGSKPSAIATGDLNADGFLDVATANTDGHYVSVLFGDGDGSFQPVTNIDIGR